METGYYANETDAYFVTEAGKVFLIDSADEQADVPREVDQLPKDVEWIQDGADRPELVARVAMIVG